MKRPQPKKGPTIPPRIQSIVKAWPSAASAILLLLAFPPFNLGLLVLVALVPWLISLRDTTGKGAWRSGYCFGFIYGLGQLFWVEQLVSRWVGSVWMGIIPWFIACALYSIYFGWVAVLIRHCWNRNWLWAIPLVWAGIEVFRSFIPSFAFPWGLLASPLWPYTALIQNAHFGTIYMVSAWVVLINLLVCLLLVGLSYRRMRSYISVAAVGAVMSVVWLDTVEPSTKLTVTAGQPGVDMAFSDPDIADEAMRRNVNAITDRADVDGTKLLVLPEGIAMAPTMPPKAPFRISTKVPVIFGGRRSTNPTFQSAFGFDGKRWQYEDKTRLVVFGEYVPGRDLFPFLTSAFKLPGEDFVAGREGVKAFDIAGTKVGPIVCFEALFPDVSFLQAAQGSRLLAVIGIDDWYMDGNAPDQIRAASVWRAVETGLPLVRAMSTGYTMAVDGHGHILAMAPLRTPIGLKVDMPIPDKSPLFRAAPVFPALSCVFALVMPWAKRGHRAQKGPNSTDAA